MNLHAACPSREALFPLWIIIYVTFSSCIAMITLGSYLRHSKCNLHALTKSRHLPLLSSFSFMFPSLPCAHKPLPSPPNGQQSCHATNPNSLNIHIICHTHLDTGWVETYDEYYHRCKIPDLICLSRWITLLISFQFERCEDHLRFRRRHPE